MGTITQTPKRCVKCGTVTFRRSAKKREPLCLGCAIETMSENVYSMRNPDQAWRRKRLEGMRDKAIRDLTQMDEEESLTRQGIPDYEADSPEVQS